MNCIDDAMLYGLGVCCGCMTYYVGWFYLYASLDDRCGV